MLTQPSAQKSIATGGRADAHDLIARMKIAPPRIKEGGTQHGSGSGEKGVHSPSTAVRVPAAHTVILTPLPHPPSPLFASPQQLLR